MPRDRSALSRRGVLLAGLAAPFIGARSAQARERVTFVLNWTAAADHCPYFLAKAQGWYEQAGLDVTIEAGRGSGASAQRIAAGTAQLGIADMPTALLARSRGGNLAAVMTVYANSPQTFYWLRSNGISGPRDFPGRSIGNPPGDAARVMWPVFARRVRIEPNSVRFVNIAPPAKIPSLKNKIIDITTDFWNEHDLKLREFGPDLGFQRWSEIGLNTYGNSIIANGDVLAKQPEMVKAFVQVSQRAFAATVADPEPALRALFAAVSGLDDWTQRRQWERVQELMRDPTTTSVALGAFDATRMKADYDLIQSQFEGAQPFDLEKAYTNAFLDTGIKMKTA
ncbi:NitT/TauT family transport system substrate-binding protein [Roseomonas rosea]|uniref:NitT/TauT family transport system substrate-binding protein n=1 Tax=Muricoccus roseus TaxID=198092 RepID=A0A1M6HR02_9PROT|nr:ABC transporter substrate-binding protein [Roseomonas rosea]SHJ24628.1 NitT/TauT family transport system substrate-binding protein [Roseomonas rosea]